MPYWLIGYFSAFGDPPPMYHMHENDAADVRFWSENGGLVHMLMWYLLLNLLSTLTMSGSYLGSSMDVV
jgi:hypothetical protein